jgi:hypothetical protein
MRLRLWWHICVLDSRAPEDQGFQPTVDLTNQDLRLPLNLNDDQIYPNMPQLPAGSSGWTEMSFFLIQTDSCRVVHPVLDSQHRQFADALLHTKEKESKIQDPGQYLSVRYGVSPESEPAHDLIRVASQHVTTAWKKMNFVLQLREEVCARKKNDRHKEPTSHAVKSSFELACDTLESSHLLKNGLPGKFRWFFNMYTQWYALAYVLRRLYKSPVGSEAERAWTLVESLFPHQSNMYGLEATVHDEHGHGRIWTFLKRLREQVRVLRQHGQPPSARQDNQLPLSPGRPVSNHNLPNSQIPQSTCVQGADIWSSAFLDWGNNSFASSDQDLLLLPELSYIPDWNAIINSQ